MENNIMKINTLGKSVNREVCSSVDILVSDDLLHYIQESITYDMKDLVSNLVFVPVWDSVVDSVINRL
jgi:hypothetical protein